MNIIVESLMWLQICYLH